MLERFDLKGKVIFPKHTLEEKAAGYAFTVKSDVARIDMYECLSNGFLRRNNLNQYSDYCDHCIGWIGPMMRDVGFVVNHDHNHHGQCGWSFGPNDDLSEPAQPRAISREKSDVQLRPNWNSAPKAIDVFARVFNAESKRPGNTERDSAQ